MRIVWSPTARRDLRHLRDYIGENNPAVAAETARKIVSATRRLVDYPGSGRLGRLPHTRELVVPGTPFILPYTVRGEEVRIIAVLHAARKWPD